MGYNSVPDITGLSSFV